MSECPCGSGKDFALCCEPILVGREKAATPEMLMRARYSAYATKNVDFVYSSSCGAAKKEFDRPSTEKWAENSEWKGLTILSTEGGAEGDTEGKVEFLAVYAIKDTTFQHHEIAEFKRIDGDWKFSDGKVIGPEPFQRETPKIGRNDPCPCGSGKKYKKCCGKNVPDNAEKA